MSLPLGSPLFGSLIFLELIEYLSLPSFNLPYSYLLLELPFQELDLLACGTWDNIGTKSNWEHRGLGDFTVSLKYGEKSWETRNSHFLHYIKMCYDRLN